MINKIEEVTLASSYCKAVKQLGLIFLSVVVLVASFLAFKGVFSFGGMITIVLLLLIFSALGASSGGVTFTRENIEISRKIILYKYRLSLPTNRFSKLKIMLKYSSSIWRGWKYSLLFGINYKRRVGVEYVFDGSNRHG